MLDLSYGGALVLKEAKEGKEGNLSTKDIFLSSNFMCLCHSIIEDTLLIYGSLSGILIGRFIFSFCVIFILGKLLNVIPEKTFYRYLFKKA